MQELPSSSKSEAKPHRSLLERLTALLSPEPANRAALLDVLQDAHERNLIDADALSMIEGVFEVSDLSVHGIMVPGSQMDVININEPIDNWMPAVLSTDHSRFPVVEDEHDSAIGMLLAKDLLGYYAHELFDVRAILRPAVFILESKRLNVLLRDFRSNRNHMAIVVDEYGGVAGLITMEDVLEQIVRDIEDEYDIDEDKDGIVPIKDGQHGLRWRIKGLTEISHCNEVIGAQLFGEEAHTIGGLIANHLSRVPVKGDQLELDGIQFMVAMADARQVHLILAERIFSPQTDQDLF